MDQNGQAYLIRIIREVDLVEDLSGLVLNGLNLNLMRRIFPLTVTQRFLKPLNGIQRDGVTPGTQKQRQLLHERLAANEQSAGKPHQLPATLLAEPVPVVRQLLHDLAEYFIAKNFLHEKNTFLLLLRHYIWPKILFLLVQQSVSTISKQI